MILAFDTYYFDNKAKTVAIAFKKWSDDQMYQSYSEALENSTEYRSGEFYKRELPCILSLYRKIQLENLETIIIDGFVYLDDNLKLGLGGYLYKELGCRIPIIGVAKSDFVGIQKNKRELFRGKSKHPLYITAAGMDVDTAMTLINKMNGPFRIPTILKTVDLMTKDKNGD